MSADVNTTKEFWGNLDKLIVKENCLPEEILIMNENSLFWKQMLERTFILKGAKSMPGFKAFKDQKTVLLGCNVSGYTLKPSVIWQGENPRAFEHISKHTLPGSYRSSKKSWLTLLLSHHALLNCHANEMKKYCLKNNIPFKILLVFITFPNILLLWVIFIPMA